jgi:Domain of unknown function (DUF1707)
MSVPQWQNLPVPPNSGGEGWNAFSADPRDPLYQQLRASDADRSQASTMLAGAYAEGRLDSDEYEQRLDQVRSSKSLGELVPVLADVIVAPGQAAAPPGPRFAPSGQFRGQPGMVGPFPRWWIGLAVLFNVIWLLTCLTAGRLIYYWPMWPMLGTAIPMIMGLMAAGGRGRNRTDRRQIPQQPEPPERDLR